MARDRPVRPGHPYLAGPPVFVAHRGGARMAPENTLEALRQAVDDWGVDMLEVDARLTRDGRVVLLHDATVDRTTDGRGAVRDLTWEAVRELDAGYRFVDLDGRHSWRGRGVRVPLFEEVLEAFPRVRINVETKSADVARPLVEIVRRHGAHARVLLAAEHEHTRREARGYPGPWGASARQIAAFWALCHLRLEGAYRPPFDILQVPEHRHGVRVVSPGFVRAAHRVNVPVHVWTVDDAPTMERLLDWGVDGIQTDRLDVLARVLVARGRPPPPVWRRREPIESAGSAGGGAA